MRDLKDGEPWSKRDLENLRAAIEIGDTIEKAARYLCRATSIEEVGAKARELGLLVRHDRIASR